VKTSAIVTLLVITSSLTAHAGSGQFQPKGYIQNDEGQKCSYTQTSTDQSTYFHGSLTNISGTITFDDPTCMKDNGIGLETDMMMINNVISGWYGQSDARFKTRASELYPSSLLQTRGKCIQSSNYKALGVAVDYVVKNNAIVQVVHGGIVQGCTGK